MRRKTSSRRFLATRQLGDLATRNPGLPNCQVAQLPDYLARGLDIIFVGINPGVQSARAGHYYANPRNPFWRLLYRAGLTPRQLRPDEDHLLPTFGYGITDIVKRPSRGVADLDAAAFRQGRHILEKKLLAYQPRIVCFNSKTGFVKFFGSGAFKRFGRQDVTTGTSRVFVMPSTSPANAGHPVAAKLRYLRALRRWRDTLAHGVGGTRDRGSGVGDRRRSSPRPRDGG